MTNVACNSIVTFDLTVFKIEIGFAGLASLCVNKLRSILKLRMDLNIFESSEDMCMQLLPGLMQQLLLKCG